MENILDLKCYQSLMTKIHRPDFIHNKIIITCLECSYNESNVNLNLNGKVFKLVKLKPILDSPISDINKYENENILPKHICISDLQIIEITTWNSNQTSIYFIGVFQGIYFILDEYIRIHKVDMYKDYSNYCLHISRHIDNNTKQKYSPNRNRDNPGYSKWLSFLN